MRRVLTDVHVNKMLFVLVDWTPHIRLGLLILFPSILNVVDVGAGLVHGGVVPVRYHCLVCCLTVRGERKMLGYCNFLYFFVDIIIF